MKKIMMVIMTCLMLVGLVGCSGKTALDITKENYKEFGYTYASSELDKMTKEHDNSGKYDTKDLISAREFLLAVEFDVNVGGKTTEEIEDMLNNNKNN